MYLIIGMCNTKTTPKLHVASTFSVMGGLVVCGFCYVYMLDIAMPDKSILVLFGKNT